MLTVSPIRYRKYGYHGSQLSKAALLLAADEVVRAEGPGVTYFPAYELLNDELRDYRFYAPDMLHPSQQAVDYLRERFVEAYFSSPPAMDEGVGTRAGRAPASPLPSRLSRLSRLSPASGASARRPAAEVERVGE